VYGRSRPSPPAQRLHLFSKDIHSVKTSDFLSSFVVEGLSNNNNNNNTCNIKQQPYFSIFSLSTMTDDTMTDGDASPPPPPPPPPAVEYRMEHDLIGDEQVPKDAYYGIQTQRA
jgi:hypothetical protein